EDGGDVACYRLHETMREYTGLKLRDAGEAEMVELRCAEYYRGRCQQLIVDARYRLVEWLDWMDLEIDNVRSVLQRCITRRDSQRGLDLARFIGWDWGTPAASRSNRWFGGVFGSANGRPPAPPTS